MQQGGPRAFYSGGEKVSGFISTLKRYSNPAQITVTPHLEDSIYE
jgi:hypothetical protein